MTSVVTVVTVRAVTLVVTVRAVTLVGAVSTNGGSRGVLGVSRIAGVAASGCVTDVSMLLVEFLSLDVRMCWHRAPPFHIPHGGM
ncbi:MAG: hypothetical protein ACK5O2_10935 [Microthrixaceae bacterium]